MDFSKYGLKEGALKFLKVIAWVAGSGAVAALIAELANYEPRTDQLWAVLAVMLANAILAGARDWLTTHKP